MLHHSRCCPFFFIASLLRFFASYLLVQLLHAPSRAVGPRLSVARRFDQVSAHAYSFSQFLKFFKLNAMFELAIAKACVKNNAKSGRRDESESDADALSILFDLWLLRLSLLLLLLLLPLAIRCLLAFGC